MSAIKRVSALFLALLILLCACGSAAPGVRYSTGAVETRAFKRTTSLQGSILYFSVQAVYAPEPGARLGQALVTPGSSIQPGDPVATYTLPASATEIKQREVDLRAALDDFAYESAARAALLEEMRAQLEAEPDETEARILELRIARQTYTDEKWRAEAEETIAQFEAAYQAAMTAGDEKTVYAEISGVVDSVIQIDSGALIAEKPLAVVRDPENALVRVDNPNGLFKYGMDAELRLSGPGGQLAAKGKVVAADNVLPGALRSGYAYIAWEAAAAAYSSATATAVTMYIPDVSVAPSQAVTYRDGRHFVEILGPDGAVHTRHVVKAMDNGSDAWIALGAAAGDKLIIK